jgi:hypothetical protein
MKVEIVRVNGVRAKRPKIIARVDGIAVDWSPERSVQVGLWSCEECYRMHECDHVRAVIAVLAPSVFAHEWELVKATPPVIA